MHDIQLSQLETDKFVQVCNPVQIFEIDWSDSQISDASKRTVIEAQSELDCEAQVWF